MSASEDTPAADPKANGTSTPKPSTKPQRSLLSIPAPIKALFDRFPLHSYPPNPRPLSSTTADDPTTHTLYVHSTPSAADHGQPSLHPGSLKWQTLLRIYGIPITLKASTTHASPNAALPFLLPSASSSNSRDPLTPSTLPAWIRAQSTAPARAPTNALHDALLYPIRLAYLHAAYLVPRVFATHTSAIHIAPATRTPVIQDVLAWYLQSEAAEEITAASGALRPRIDAGMLYADATDALAALSTVLGDSRWFGRRRDAPAAAREGLEDDGLGNWEVPGLLDAGVFAYVHVLLEMLAVLPAENEGDTQHARGLYDELRGLENLVAHRERMLRHYY